MAAGPALLPVQGIPRPASSARVPVPLHHDTSSRPSQPCTSNPENGGIRAAACCVRLGPALGGALKSPRPGDKGTAPARVWGGEVKTGGHAGVDDRLVSYRDWLRVSWGTWGPPQETLGAVCC